MTANVYFFSKCDSYSASEKSFVIKECPERQNETGTGRQNETGTGRREHVDVFLCAPIKSLIFFLSLYVMSLNSLLVSNVKRKLHRRDSEFPSPKAKVRKIQEVS